MPMLAPLLMTVLAADPRAQLLARAKRGEVKAEVQLALSLQDPKQGPVDLPASERWLRMAATTGDAEGEFYLGRLLHLVEGAHHNVVEARSWYEKAAAQGNFWAVNNLGLLAEDSDDPRVRATIIGYFRKAAEGGEVHGEGNLAAALHHGYWNATKDPAQARVWYAKAGAQGDSNSEAILGVMLWDGEGGPKDLPAAKRHLSRAADLGDPWGTLNLGIYLEEGHDSPPDYAGARACYLRAAELGETNAFERLGWLSCLGRGVPKDMEAARQWCLKATHAGDAHAWAALGTMYINKDNPARSDAEAIKYFFMGAYLGEPLAENDVGAFYHHGRGGLPQNLVNAYAWFTLAVEGDDPTAKGNLATLRKQIGMMERLKGERLALELRMEIARRKMAAEAHGRPDAGAQKTPERAGREKAGENPRN